MKKVKLENRIIKSEITDLIPESLSKFLDEQEQIEKTNIKKKYSELKKRLDELTINIKSNNK